MSGITDAINACHKLKDAMTHGDVDKVNKVLNEQVRSPNTEAKGYVRGYWMASRRFCTDAGLHNTPILKVTQLGQWHCYRIDDPNP